MAMAMDEIKQIIALSVNPFMSINTNCDVCGLADVATNMFSLVYWRWKDASRSDYILKYADICAACVHRSPPLTAYRAR